MREKMKRNVIKIAIKSFICSIKQRNAILQKIVIMDTILITREENLNSSAQICGSVEAYCCARTDL